MARRKNTTTTRTPSKRNNTSKSEIGSVAAADAVGCGTNGHPTMALASEASIRAQIEFRGVEVLNVLLFQQSSRPQSSAYNISRSQE